MFADLLPTVLKPMAKAVAVFVVSWLVAIVAWLVAATGVEIPFDPAVAETVISSLLLAAVTYLTTNVKAP